MSAGLVLIIIFWIGMVTMTGVAATGRRQLNNVRSDNKKLQQDKDKLEATSRELVARNLKLVLEKRSLICDRDAAYAEWLRLRNIKLDEFKAFQECPKCKSFDTHFINLEGEKLERECTVCQHKWHQS
jgi:hypothetical protein